MSLCVAASLLGFEEKIDVEMRRQGALNTATATI